MSGDIRSPQENAEIVKRVVEVAKNKGATPVQVALSWPFIKGVTAPIIGTTSVEHLEEAVGSLSVSLNPDEVKYLGEPYRPKPLARVR